MYGDAIGIPTCIYWPKSCTYDYVVGCRLALFTCTTIAMTTADNTPLSPMKEWWHTNN